MISVAKTQRPVRRTPMSVTFGRPVLRPYRFKRMIVLIGLTKRELETLRYASLGFTSIEIGQALCLSPSTIDTHRKNILGKLNMSNLTQAVAYALRNKLIE